MAWARSIERFDPRLGREVALKIIGRFAADDESALDRLLREATLASALNHPNIVTIYETGVVGTDRYIAMELVEGSTLRQLAAQGLPLSRIIGIARQVAEAFAVAHASQIIHRDIKPDNVMVRPDGYAKLLDFGLARTQPDQFRAGSTGAGRSTTEAGLILGTIGYMAPEQARGEPVSAEADVFALGVVLYELVTGRHPFMAASQLGTLNSLLWDTPEPPSLLNPELPRALDQLIVESLQKDQRLRPGASEVMYRLALAHDSNIATALSSVAVAPRRAGGHSRTSSVAKANWTALRHEFDAGAAGQGPSGRRLGRSWRRQDDARRGLRQRARGAWRTGARRPGPLLGAARRQRGLPARTRGPRKPAAQRAARQPDASRPRARARAGTAQLMPPSANDSSAARLAAETVGGSQERLKREIASLLEEAGRHAADRAVVRRRALGGSVDDRSARLPGAAARHARGCSSSPPRARPSSPQSRHPFLLAEARSRRRMDCAARSCPPSRRSRRSSAISRCSFPSTRFHPASPG